MAQTPRELKFLALGDSYTIGESVAEKDRWPVQLAAQLRAKGLNVGDPKIIATTGWRTDDLKNAIVKDNPSTDYDYVSLLIGVNNQYQGKSSAAYAPEFEELLKMAIEFAGGDRSKVFVVSIPDYGFTPFGKEKKETITKAIDEFNAVNKSITENTRSNISTSRQSPVRVLMIRSWWRLMGCIHPGRCMGNGSR